MNHLTFFVTHQVINIIIHFFKYYLFFISCENDNVTMAPAVSSLLRSVVSFENGKMWWSATAVYAAYVVLGGFSPKAHEHVFTRDPSKNIIKEVLKGKLASFSKPVYS